MHVVVNRYDFLQVFLSGRIDRQELFDAQEKLMSHPEYFTKNAMWMFDHSISGEVTEDSCFAALVGKIKANCRKNNSKTKTALIVSSASHMGLLSRFCQEADTAGLPFRFRAFRDYADAQAWLSAPGA